MLPVSLNTPEWFRRASCRGCPTEMFYPEGGMAGAEIKALCGKCPVREECYEYALSMPQDEDRCGIFAGTSARDRQKARQARQRGLDVRLGTYAEQPRKAVGFRWNAITGKYETVRG